MDWNIAESSTPESSQEVYCYGIDLGVYEMIDYKVLAQSNSNFIGVESGILTRIKPYDGSR